MIHIEGCKSTSHRRLASHDSANLGWSNNHPGIGPCIRDSRRLPAAVVLPRKRSLGFFPSQITTLSSGFHQNPVGKKRGVLSGNITKSICGAFSAAFLEYLRNLFAPYRGRNPQNRERRVSESKNPHFPPPQKRALRVKKSPFLYRAPQGKWGFFVSERPFLGWWEKGVF